MITSTVQSKKLPYSDLLVFKSKLTNGKEVRVLGDYNKPLFIAKDIAEMLGYKDTDQALRKNVDDEDKISYSDSRDKSDPVVKTGSELHPRTVLVNESGLYSLILRSKLQSAREFKRWVTSEVLPGIRKSGEYKLEEYKIQLQIEKQEGIQRSWIVKYDKRCVVYIGYIGIIDGKETYKFGWTDDINRRCKDHKNDFGRFDLLFVIECEQNNVLEQKLKNHPNIKKVRFSHIFNTKNKTELLALNSEFTIENVKDILKKLKITLNNQKYIDLKHKERVMELENEKLKEETKQKQIESSREIELSKIELMKIQEETKQKEIELKILEIKQPNKIDSEDEIEFEIVESDDEEPKFPESVKVKLETYYDKNKDRLLSKMKEKLKCVCGSTITRAHKAKHERTQKHILYAKLIKR